MAIEWCVVVVPMVDGEAKGVAVRDAVWPRDSVISISFLDGDAELRKRVRACADTWLTLTGAKLKFQWRNDNDTDVRISFAGAGSWSILGARVRWPEFAGKKTATMNFGWLEPQSTDLQVQEVVLHEFGHMLGLAHEHQHPESQIPWNRSEVIRLLSQNPPYWSVQRIEHNVLNGLDPREVLSTRFDPASIMLYPVKKEWTDGKYESKNNTAISAGDIAIIKKLYVE